MRGIRSTYLAGCGKTIVAYENFDGLHVRDNRGTLLQETQKVQPFHLPNLGNYFTIPP
jgi:hypothetical protein